MHTSPAHTNTQQKINTLQRVLFGRGSHLSPIERLWSVVTFVLGTISLFFVIALADTPVHKLISPAIQSLPFFQTASMNKKDYPTFTFAPGGSSRKLAGIDFTNLSTIAYFDFPIEADGSIDTDTDSYYNLTSSVGENLLAEARNHNTKVLLTLTQTTESYIRHFLTSSDAQNQTISEAITLVQETGTDGVVLDIELGSSDAAAYQPAFTDFATRFATQLHEQVPGSQFAVAVSPGELYDHKTLSSSVDKLFVMAYTFAVPERNSTSVAAPVYAYQEEEYWKDVDTTMKQIAQDIPEERFVMEQAWYGNGENYPFFQAKNRGAVVDNSASENTMSLPLSEDTIDGLVSEVPAKARAAARKNLPAIAEALQREGILNANVLAYALATIEHETASTFEPIEEFKGRKSARRLGYEGGTNYFGRGFIQLTHLRNYKWMGERIGMGDALVKHPELASKPDVSARVLAAFFKDNGVARLATNGSFIAARTPINPDYQGNWIASLAWKYLEMIG